MNILIYSYEYMNIKGKQIQFLKVNTRKYLYDFWLGEDFLNIIQCTNHEDGLASVQPHVWTTYPVQTR